MPGTRVQLPPPPPAFYWDIKRFAGITENTGALLSKSACNSAACLIGEYGEAKQFLEKALAKADEKLKRRALADPNLAELWKRIGTL